MKNNNLKSIGIIVGSVVGVSAVTTGVVYSYAKKVEKEEAEKLGYTWNEETKQYEKKIEGSWLDVMIKKNISASLDESVFQNNVNNRVSEFTEKLSIGMNAVSVILIIASIIKTVKAKKNK